MNILSIKDVIIPVWSWIIPVHYSVLDILEGFSLSDLSETVEDKTASNSNGCSSIVDDKSSIEGTVVGITVGGFDIISFPLSSDNGLVVASGSSMFMGSSGIIAVL